MLKSSKMFNAFKAFFNRSLKKHPVLTNTSVYASFYLAAEISQQTFNRLYSPEKPDYNFKAAARIAAVGSGIYAPILYYWYKYLDSRFSGTAVKTVMTKVACDQLIMTPFLLACFFTGTSISVPAQLQTVELSREIPNENPNNNLPDRSESKTKLHARQSHLQLQDR
ncbi:mpv17-like protein isoform X3 [Trichoplusia ni]|uniref:Mpv17-like protein isoform X3 n=1 Tax=Trichoplusia ni TaxID=7111 RepID=A0A7E5WBD4_TRINI|nr:mpv17-like protein isoform X3 [Trichoplusia ni]